MNVKQLFLRYCNGQIGVPVTYLDKYSAEWCKIVGISGDLANPILIEGKRCMGRFYLDGKRLYDRIVIKQVC